MNWFSEELIVFPQRYAGHLWLSISAVMTGLLISLPAGIWAAKRPSVSGPVLGFASLVQTIPGLALLALMVPILGGRIGFLPAYLALTLYSVLPILRNTIVGLNGVPANVKEAALGVGMTERQRLWRVELPLALPVMVAGLRTSIVWVVGAATLSTPVGAESLGNYIFAGLQTRDWTMVLFGCLASAGLALILDQIVRLIEISVSTGKTSPAVTSLIGLLLVCSPVIMDFSGSKTVQNRGTQDVVAETGPSSLEGQEIAIGAKPFTEQYILAELLKQRLEARGARVTVRDGLGSIVGFDALTDDQIDVFIDYTGTVWATVMNRAEPVGRYRMFGETSAFLMAEHNVLALGRLGFENAYVLAISEANANQLGVQSIGDLAGKADVSIGGDVEFFARPEWLRVRDAYGLDGLRTRGMDSTFMYSAARDREVDVITAYTTDGRIDAFDLILLDDPLGALPPYDAFILISPENLDNLPLQQALSELNNAISAELMRQANGKVDIEGRSISEAAEWLNAQLD
ncbi:MAG: ABC transporter permease [Ponticaulis sp.]|nr:ABC transporter permease [Ponticaulis sp.]